MASLIDSHIAAAPKATSPISHLTSPVTKTHFHHTSRARASQAVPPYVSLNTELLNSYRIRGSTEPPKSNSELSPINLYSLTQPVNQPTQFTDHAIFPLLEHVKYAAIASTNPQFRPRPLHGVHDVEGSLGIHGLLITYRRCPVRVHGTGFPARRPTFSVEQGAAGRARRGRGV